MSDLEWHENKLRRRMEVAAPQMLETLKAVEPLMVPGLDWTNATALRAMVRAAIKAAEGEQ
jgi:hypothetical protein